MPDNDLSAILDATTAIYTAHKAAWMRDERRLYGGDAVLSELTQWKGETTDLLEARKQDAHYMNFPKLHAEILAGHLARVRPVPGTGFSLGTLGTIRPTQEIKGRPSLAELIYYNVDGIGNDGNEWAAWTDGVQERACATGFRWTLVEMPALADVRPGVAPGATATEEDVRNGFRPYAVEYSPLAVPYWEIDRGRLDVAVIRVPMRRTVTTAAGATPLGYYLLVREGYTGLGNAFAEGGWWLFDDKKASMSNGRWTSTGGQIPLFPLLADDTKGTWERPAMARSLTMELGQLAIGLMRRMSERDYNASQAAKAINFILGANPGVDPTTGKPEDWNLSAKMLEDGSLMVPIFPFKDENGNWHAPQLWNSSAAAVPSEVFTAVISGKIEEAREIMVRAVSGPAASGAARGAEFRQEKSPLLSRLAANRQRWEQTLTYFFERRAGHEQPTGFSAWPREFDLAPVVDDIDAQLATMREAAISSPTLTARLVTMAAKERGLLGGKATEETVLQELTDSATDARQADARERDLGTVFPPPPAVPQPEPAAA